MKYAKFLPEIFKTDKINFYENDYFTDINLDINKNWNESAFGIHLPHLLHYDDRNTMFYGIEGRSPFLDHRLWELVGNWNPLVHLNLGLRKVVLRQAFKDRIPESIQLRKDKIGFFTPIHELIWSNIDKFEYELKTFFESNEQINGDLNLYKNKEWDNMSSRRIFRSALISKFIKSNTITL
jgi:asparagine synthase (glutamine-hydrolysing)